MTAQKADLRPDLENRLRFESLLADLSSRFVNLEPGEVHRGIEDAQRRVCECLELDLSSLGLWSAENPYDLTLAHLISATDHDLTI